MFILTYDREVYIKYLFENLNYKYCPLSISLSVLFRVISMLDLKTLPRDDL